MFKGTLTRCDDTSRPAESHTRVAVLLWQLSPNNVPTLIYSVVLMEGSVFLLARLALFVLIDFFFFFTTSSVTELAGQAGRSQASSVGCLCVF